MHLSVLLLLLPSVLGSGYPWAPLPYKHSTSKLSEPRRNLGAATAADGRVYFVGGCLTTGGGSTQFICDNASTAIDVLDAQGTLVKTLQMSEARGWVATCAIGSLVVMAGGGTSGTLPHSATADILDTRDFTQIRKANALSNGRWGVSCASVGDSLYFFGGKVTIHGYDNAWMSPRIDVFSLSSNTWAPNAYNMSQERESTVAATTSTGGIVVAGGWRYQSHGAGATPLLESYLTPGNNAQSGGRVVSSLKTAAYDVGMVALGDHVYIAGNQYLHVVDSQGAVTTAALPPPLSRPPAGNTGGGIIPASHVPQNGVAVGPHACFYGSTPPAVYCYHTTAHTWSMLNCTVEHQGGSIVLVNDNTIMVAGGFDPTTGTTNSNAVVDIFQL